MRRSGVRWCLFSDYERQYGSVLDWVTIAMHIKIILSVTTNVLVSIVVFVLACTYWQVQGAYFAKYHKYNTA